MQMADSKDAAAAASVSAAPRPVASILNPSTADPRVIDQVLELMKREWPAQTHESRLEAVKACSGRVELPATIILTLPAANDNTAPTTDKASSEPAPIVVAHSQLQIATDHTDGQAAIVYSVVVHHAHRRKGYGRVLMEFTEHVAREAGFSFLYLSTGDMQDFYKSLGYKLSQAVSFLGKNANRITASQLEGLEGLFLKRAAQLGMKKGNFVNSAHNYHHTWFRKRLIEEQKSVFQTDEEAQNEIWSVFGHVHNRPPGKWLSCLINVPSQRQVGPSCGLALLRMIRDFVAQPDFATRSKPSVHRVVEARQSADATKPATVPFEATSSSLEALLEALHELTISDNATSLSGSTSGESKATADSSADTPAANPSPTSDSKSDRAPLSLLETAIELGMTQEGEMFCIEDYARLCQLHFGFRTRICDFTATNTLNALAAGDLCLVSYDRDHSHLPSIEGGAKAHWLLLHGFFLSDNSSSAKGGKSTAPDPVFLVGKHGMNLRSLVADFDELRQSNAQLTGHHPRFKPKKINLRNKMMIISVGQPRASNA